MKSFLQEIEDKFVELEEASQDEIDNQELLNQKMQKTLDLTKQLKTTSLQDGVEEEELEEASNTGGLDGGAGPPQVPAAFAKPGKWKNKDKTYETVQKAMDRKYERLIESYAKFSRGDKKMTPKRKVERTIQEVSKKLKEIETIVNHTNKLKIESGMSRDNYGPRTEKALNKISEKLIKIAERVRAIGE